MSDAETREPNLLIIRRGGAAELETPKGGVWKIAYADFMTAMMAFFLVMWLINATSETTKTGVANYFNPIKLADGTQLPKKGLQDPEVGDHGEADEGGHEPDDSASEHADTGEAEAEGSEQGSSEKRARFSEEALFRDPYAVLAAIAAEAEGGTPLIAKGGGVGLVGAGGEDRAGDIYGDPFDPAAWQVTSAPAMGQPSDAMGSASIPTGSAALAGTDGPPEEADAGLPMARQAAELQADTAGIAAAAAGIAGEVPGTPGDLPPSAAEAAFASQVANDLPSADSAGEGTEQHAAGGAAGAAEQHAGGGGGYSASGEQVAGSAEDHAGTGRLRERIAEVLEPGSTQAPNVTVENADGGVLISLADQVEFGMFAVGSAEPLPETIAVMEKIAALLNTMPGKVVVRGHTDARPFRSGEYDNWRLSSARAHMAYHMLVRGGLDESRVERIEGYADRALKLPDDPEAAENRRIDILVQEIQS